MKVSVHTWGHLSKGKEKAALRAAESLIVVFSRKVEAQFGDFSIAAFKELVYAPRNEVFVNLYLKGRGERGLTPSEVASWG